MTYWCNSGELKLSVLSQVGGCPEKVQQVGSDSPAIIIIKWSCTGTMMYRCWTTCLLFYDSVKWVTAQVMVLESHLCGCLYCPINWFTFIFLHLIFLFMSKVHEGQSRYHVRVVCHCDSPAITAVSLEREKSSSWIQRKKRKEKSPFESPVCYLSST